MGDDEVNEVFDAIATIGAMFDLDQDEQIRMCDDPFFRGVVLKAATANQDLEALRQQTLRREMVGPRRAFALAMLDSLNWNSQSSYDAKTKLLNLKRSSFATFNHDV